MTQTPEEKAFQLFDEYTKLSNADLSQETPRYQQSHRNWIERSVHELFHAGYLIREGQLVDKATMCPVERPQENNHHDTNGSNAI